MKNILFIASECVPFIKTGGLADVVGSLPQCIDKEYYDVRVILPKYVCIQEPMKNLLTYKTHFYMDFHWKNEYVGILEAEEDGVTYYFIDNEIMFDGATPYGKDGYKEIEKFAFFSKAALSILPIIGFKPDVIHCHDWQTGLVPVYLKERFQGNDPVGNRDPLFGFQTGRQRDQEFVFEEFVVRRQAHLQVVGPDETVVLQVEFAVEDVPNRHLGQIHDARLQD